MQNSLGRFAVSALITTVAILVCVRFAETAPPASGKDLVKEAAYDHFIRVKVMNLSVIQQSDKFNLLELKVKRFYGKIDERSAQLAKEHETQEFSILFPAAPGADVKVGDMIDYRAVKYQHIN